MIYLDNAATTLPKPPAVIDAMAWAAGHLASPGRGSSRASEQAAELLYNLRVTAGQMFSCRPEGVVLTTSATHGLNIALKSLAGPGDRAVISCVEHNAVLRPLHALGADVHVAGGAVFDSADLLRPVLQQFKGRKRSESEGILRFFLILLQALGQGSHLLHLVNCLSLNVTRILRKVNSPIIACERLSRLHIIKHIMGKRLTRRIIAPAFCHEDPGDTILRQITGRPTRQIQHDVPRVFQTIGGTSYVLHPVLDPGLSF